MKPLILPLPETILYVMFKFALIEENREIFA
jgi:hypothetical protein